MKGKPYMPLGVDGQGRRYQQDLVVDGWAVVGLVICLMSTALVLATVALLVWGW